MILDFFKRTWRIWLGEACLLVLLTLLIVWILNWRWT